jgi:hypothetical protein
MPDDRPHVDLVMHRLRKLQEAADEAGPSSALSPSSSGDIGFEMDPDLALALKLSAAEANAKSVSAEQQRELQRLERQRQELGRLRHGSITII